MKFTLKTLSEQWGHRGAHKTCVSWVLKFTLLAALKDEMVILITLKITHQSHYIVALYIGIDAIIDININNNSV